MPDNRIQDLLKSDFLYARRRLENDGFVESVLKKLSSQRRTRLIVVNAAGGAGALLAAAQFAKINGAVSAAAPLIDHVSGLLGVAGISSGSGFQLLAASALAAAFMATAYILQAEI